MPILDLSDLPEEIQLLNLISVMCFPSKKEDRKRRYLTLEQLLGIAGTEHSELCKESPNQKELSIHIGKWLGDAIADLGSWSALANASIGHGKKKSPLEEAKDRWKQAIIVGGVFNGALANGDGISSSAKRFCSDENDAKFKEKDSKLPVYDYRHIHNTLWPRYRDAAHLWAAFLEIDFKEHINKHFFFPLEEFEPGGLKGFITVAEGFRIMGESQMPPRGPRKPLLNPDSVWKITI